MTFILQVYDDEGLLACRPVSETHFQTAGGGSGPHTLHDVLSGEQKRIRAAFPKLPSEPIEFSGTGDRSWLTVFLGNAPQSSFMIHKSAFNTLHDISAEKCKKKKNSNGFEIKCS